MTDEQSQEFGQLVNKINTSASGKEIFEGVMEEACESEKVSCQTKVSKLNKGRLLEEIWHKDCEGLLKDQNNNGKTATYRIILTQF